MNAAVVKRTQEALGKVIRRPPLTEKLLSKPPFRYLHDIITEVIRVTGFMKGLYTDAEMKSDHVKDKDAKISFLQKAIDVVVIVSGEPLSAKPARIVAGREPESTNELLQRIGRCCLSKLPSDDAVKRVLAGEKGDVQGRAPLPSKPHESDNRNAREEGPGAPKDKEGRGNSEINERSTSRDRKQKELKEESKPRDKERDKEKIRETDRDRHKDPERDKGREGERERTRTRARLDRDRERGNKDRDKDWDRERERRSEGGKEKERWKDREKERERDKGRDRDRDRDRRRVKNGEHARDPGREKSREQDQPEKKSSSSREVSKKSSDGPFKDSKAETEAELSPRASRSVTTKTSRRRSKASVEGPTEANAHPASVAEGSSAGLWRDRPEPEPAATRKGDSPSDAEGEAGPTGQDKPQVPEIPEGPPDLPPDTRRLPRPGSARPAPPRVKRQDSAEVLAADRTGSGKTVSSVIVDAQASDDEDDQFVVEAEPPLATASEREGAQAVEPEEDEKHGGLVTKILETKKDYEKLQLPAGPGEKEKSLVFESAWKKEKDIVSKEIEKLRASIQTLCKSALPLGKIMDYLQEDVDAMQSELQLWRSESRQHARALQLEQSITDCAVEPLRAELAELEQLIRDQQDRICAVKAAVLRNEERIQKMVHGLDGGSRR
ncbi:TRAF3-interacting protein 1 [Pteronotus mesoamericanus]|uniref:TRAF3-interacting protein 1 n=1 Tax=Pteronotus mesoamericanus TaxID=1884717 RepID=UPI0023EBA23C|nr:TRAF3-interacting protein 1 [Pteronotus parnellii mesoamericanus]